MVMSSAEAGLLLNHQRTAFEFSIANQNLDLAPGIRRGLNAHGTNSLTADDENTCGYNFTSRTSICFDV